MVRLAILAAVALFAIGLVGAGAAEFAAPSAPILIHCPYIAGYVCAQTIDGQAVVWPAGTTVIR